MRRVMLLSKQWGWRWLGQLWNLRRVGSLRMWSTIRARSFQGNIMVYCYIVIYSCQLDKSLVPFFTLVYHKLCFWALACWRDDVTQEYAKTDGLEYICPRCSAGNWKPHTRRAKPKNSPEMSNSPPTDSVIKTHKRSWDRVQEFYLQEWQPIAQNLAVQQHGPGLNNMVCYLFFWSFYFAPSQPSLGNLWCLGPILQTALVTERPPKTSFRSRLDSVNSDKIFSLVLVMTPVW